MTSKIPCLMTFFATALIGMNLHAQTTVQVTPNNMGNWSFGTVDSSFNSCISGSNGCSTGQMVVGPTGAPYGTGSANLATAPDHGDAAAELGTTDLNGVALSALTALSYYTYDTQNNGQQFPFLELNISYTDDANHNGPGTDQLFFEPPYQTPATGGSAVTDDQGTPLLNTWQQWNALNGVWWDNAGVGGNTGGFNEVAPLSFFESYYQNATITADSFWNNNGLMFKVGEASTTDNFNGYIDGVEVAYSNSDTIYDLDPSAATPEPSTLMLLSAALAAGLIYKRRRAA